MTDVSEATGTLEVTLHVNGQPQTVRVPVDEPLLRTLRREFGLTSVRGTCGIGVCGTCTVLVDGRVASSCIMLTAQAADRRLTTSEGLRTADGDLAPVQEAFVRAGAYQCSFCIPAMALTVHAALQGATGRDTEQIREYLSGNLCRCGTYPQILEAVAELVTDDPRATDESAP